MFFNFFLLGLYLALYQVELFTAFLWLVECSVLFVFLLLLFYVNIKGFYTNNFIYFYVTVFLFWVVVLYIIDGFYYGENDNLNLYFYYYPMLDNYYESVFNNNLNDLVSFNLSYYFFNVFELLLIGFLLLIGSVICVNLYQHMKTITRQNYSNFLKIFEFFNDFVTFGFLRIQNIIKQGNTKANLKVFQKK